MTNLQIEIANLSDEELVKCFNEFEEFKKTGSTGDTLIRKLYRVQVDQLGGHDGVPWVAVQMLIYEAMATKWIEDNE